MRSSMRAGGCTAPPLGHAPLPHGYDNHPLRTAFPCGSAMDRWVPAASQCRTCDLRSWYEPPALLCPTFVRITTSPPYHPTPKPNHRLRALPAHLPSMLSPLTAWQLGEEQLVVLQVITYCSLLAALLAPR